MENKITEVKLQLKNTILSYKGIPIKNMDDIRDIAIKNPALSKEELIDKCPDIVYGEVIPEMLLLIKTENVKEKLKLQRWASKIYDKMITNKGELNLDLSQVVELQEFLEKSHSHKTNIIAPILIEFEKLKEQLSSK